MASTVATALAQVDSVALDTVSGLVKPRYPHAPTPDAIRSAFERFDYREVRKIASWLTSRYDNANSYDAEDAVQEALSELLAQAPDRCAQPLEKWKGLLRTVAQRRLYAELVARRTLSIAALHEAVGDAAFRYASPCTPASAASQDHRDTPAPAGRRPKWTREQMIGAAQRFRDRTGRPPRRRELGTKNDLPSIAPIENRFGTLSALILEAGMTPESTAPSRRRWTFEEAVKVCADFRNRKGYWPSSTSYRFDRRLPNSATLWRLFGTSSSSGIQAAVEKAVLDTADAEAVSA